MCNNNINIKLNGKKEYDFYIDDYDGIIIEVQGRLHYTQRFKNVTRLRNLEDEKENDKIKEELANPYVKHYIKLDYNIMDIEKFKNNIMQSNLPKILAFKELDINWIQCHEYSLNSRVKQACEIWNDEQKNVHKIAKIMNIDRHTVWTYLRQGAICGWCDYNSEEQIKNNSIRAGNDIKKRNMKSVICVTNRTVYPSMAEAGRQFRMNPSGIARNCQGEHKHAGMLPDGTLLQWMYLDEYMRLNGYTDISQIPNVTIHEEEGN